DKDPFGWREFHAQLAEGSAKGHALTQRGVQVLRPSRRELGPELEKLDVPALIMTGDEDDPCLEPGIFMKRKIPTAGLVVLPKSGHTINLEEPEAFNRAVLDFLTAVDAGKWTRRNPASQTGAAVLPAETRCCHHRSDGRPSWIPPAPARARPRCASSPTWAPTSSRSRSARRWRATRPRSGSTS